MPDALPPPPKPLTYAEGMKLVDWLNWLAVVYPRVVATLFVHPFPVRMAELQHDYLDHVPQMSLSTVNPDVVRFSDLFAAMLSQRNGFGGIVPTFSPAGVRFELIGSFRQQVTPPPVLPCG